MKANGDAIICDIGASRTTELKLVNVKQRTRARHSRTSNSAQLLPNQEKPKMQTSIRQPKYKPVDEPNDCIYWSKQDLKKIISEYEVLVRRFLDVGWDGYIVTVDFNELRGAEETQVTQMRQAMEKLYAALSKSLVGTIRPKRQIGRVRANRRIFPTSVAVEVLPGRRSGDEHGFRKP